MVSTLPATFGPALRGRPAPTVPAPRRARPPAPARNAGDAFVRSAPAADPPAGLTPEEARFLAAGMLPANYPAQKARMAAQGREAAMQLAREGLAGPFSRAFGDPVNLLESARRRERNPELDRLAKDLRKGDILVTTWNNTGDFISTFTRGPFTHALLCVKDGPDPAFIEAIGVTAPGDPSADRVRRVSFAEQTWDGQTFRLLRPTAGMPAGQRAAAVDRAVAYAERQLGRPYDYTFTDADHQRGGIDAFYCSELASLAYTEGAKVPLPIAKSPRRDGVLVGLAAIADALGPRDRLGLATRVFHFVNRRDRPTTEQLSWFLADEVLPGCKATEALGRTDAEKRRVAAAIATVIEGEAFPRLEQALAKGQGRLDVARAVLADVRALMAQAGVSGWEAFKLGRTLLSAVLPHSEALAGFVFGPESAQAQAARRTLDQLEGARAALRKIPLLGRFLAKLVPGRATEAIKRDFTSPSDLAWAAGAYRADYNVKPGHPLDPGPGSLAR